jgi:hypothetical protein
MKKRSDSKLDPQKGIPREREEVGIKILSAGRDGSPAKLSQISYSFHYLQVLTKNFDLNLAHILEIKSIEYLKVSI